MKILTPFLVGILTLASSMGVLASGFSTIPVPGVVVTGVRSSSSSTDDVVISASYTDAGLTSAAIYAGSLAGSVTAPASNWVKFAPTFSGQTVTSSTFYGPNTSLFTPSIGAGNIVAVGSYKYSQGSSGPNADHGMMYEGSTSGNGTWTQIDATSLLTGNATLLNTIAHSNMGSIVVGNYDTSLAAGKAFIFNRTTNVWSNLNCGNSTSVTAYGVWQNSSTSYTIAGGLSDLNSGGIDQGYLVDYNSETGEFDHYKTFNYNNQPITSIISHFDGITLTDTGFNLTGDYVVIGGGLGAFAASVAVLPGGGFSDAVWTDVSTPGATFISGNTIVGDNVMGIYTSNGETLSYIATIPEPTSLVLLTLGIGALFFRYRP